MNGAPFAQNQKQVASPFGAQPTPSPFSRTPNGTPASTFANATSHSTPANPFSQHANGISQKSMKTEPQGPVPVEDASTMNSYQERYDQVSQPNRENVPRFFVRGVF